MANNPMKHGRTIPPILLLLSLLLGACGAPKTKLTDSRLVDTFRPDLEDLQYP